MQKLVIDIPDNKLNFFLELVKQLGIKKVQMLTKEQKEFVEDLQQSLHEVEMHEKGKVKLQSARDFLDEL